MRLKCRTCGVVTPDGMHDLSEILGFYMYHMIRTHWEQLEIIHNLTDEDADRIFALLLNERIKSGHPAH